MIKFLRARLVTVHKRRIKESTQIEDDILKKIEEIGKITRKEYMELMI